MNARAHWEGIYRSKAVSELSWFQREARVSLDLIARAAPLRASTIVDIGGGASPLVDGLLARGYRNITIMDLAYPALQAARARLGPAARQASWVVADALAGTLRAHSVDVWHDRAVFHFLTSPDDRRRYVRQVAYALRPFGHAIVAAFAADGPARCSGLEVSRYDPEGLHAEFGASFDLLAHVREEHVTPAGIHQPFEYCLCAFRPAQSAAA